MKLKDLDRVGIQKTILIKLNLVVWFQRCNRSLRERKRKLYVLQCMRIYLTLIILLSFVTLAQETGEILLIGNHTTICIEDEKIIREDNLPKSLSNYKVVFIFSNSTSTLSDSDVDRLIDFAESGGGVYLGAENWPLQAESNQMTKKIYLKESFGDYQVNDAEIATNNGNLALDSLKKVPAGRTTVAFPMDYRLRVEAWVDDQPLILSGSIEKGRVIIDGGYSRFYCNNRSSETDQLFKSFVAFLLNLA